MSESISTRGLITNLSKKFDKLNPNKTGKPVPASYMHRRKSVHIQNLVNPIDKFPHLFPKEVGQSSQSSQLPSEERITLASLINESDKESETQVLPVYEPLES